MLSLLRFLFEKKNFLFFLLLEGLCVWMIFTFNKYQGAFYFNSSNAVAANVFTFERGITSYFDLQKQNDKLVMENMSLRKALELEKGIRKIDSLSVSDSLRRAAFDFIPARVVKNSLNGTQNFITIDKGDLDGMAPYMGLIGPQGVVGELKYCSDHYATGFSLLHVKNGISAKLSTSGAVGTLQWDGADARYAKLNYIGRHYFIQPGDSITTSGFNAVFPAGIPIGVVEKVSDDNQSFYNVTVRLATDFGSLDHVYVIRSKRKPEIDSLEINIKK
jgi:rod shape-determining protein MreC